MTDDNDAVRLDRWLHAARWFKTRSLAVEAIVNGRVEINGIGAKPAKQVRAGDVICIRRPPYSYALEVLDVSQRRLSAPLAQALYRETTASVAGREALAERLVLERVLEDPRSGKLHKKDRRERERLKRGEL